MKKALCLKFSDVFKVPRAELHKENIVANAGSLFDKESFLLDRVICETDQTYLQVIPYVTLVDRQTSEIFVYTRGKASNEKRLSGKVSLGIGGHIEQAPDGNESLLDVIINGTIRELEEEVGLLPSNSLRKFLVNKFTTNNFGCFYCNESDVDKVHLALSIIIAVNKSEITEAEKDIITRSEWLSGKNLRTLIDNDEIELENWSKLVFGLIEAKLNQ